MVELDEAGSGRPVVVQTGQQVRMTLAEAGGTGYRWQADGCGGVLKLLEEHKGVAGTNPGAAGSHIFLYAAEGAGSCELRFEFRRSWEKAGVRVVVFPITVR